MGEGFRKPWFLQDLASRSRASFLPLGKGAFFALIRLDFIDENCGFFDFRKLRATPRKKILNFLVIRNQKQLEFISEFVITYKLTFTGFLSVNR